MSMKDFLKVLSYILVAMVASIITIFLCQNSQAGKTASDPNMQKLQEIQEYIDKMYIGEADPKVMADAAASAMVTATGDRWSYYIPAAEMQAYQESMNNAYVGVGITIVVREDNTGFDIIDVTPGSPAEKAGILPQDTVIKVDGAAVSELGVDEAKNRIRGEAGTFVKLTVLRKDQELTFDVERRAIKNPVAIAEMLDNSIGLITIKNFNTNCSKETIAAITQLRKQGAKALIFDVRFNPGGYRHELVALLDYLLPEGELFRSEHYNGKQDVDYSDASYLDMPMAVLVNGESYSAAEFFAAALREYEAAVVVGQETCGKGYYQQTLPLSDGSAVALSTGKYFTPKGNSLAGVGLTPDVPVEVTDEIFAQLYYGMLEPQEDPQIQAAVAALLGE